MDDKPEQNQAASAPEKAGPKKINPGLKLALEMGPLVAFFFTNWKFGIFPATGVLMVTVIIALIASWILTKNLPVMPVVTAVAVVFFGALTFLFQSDTFIKMKPTFVNIIFGSALLGALAFGKLLLPIVLDSVMQIKEEGWRKLTVRWGVFFFFLAILNEIVWRTQTTDFWVSFKVFGIMPITLIFAMSQVPLILKYELKDEEADNAPEHF